MIEQNRKRSLYDPRAYHAHRAPFAAQMTCLGCGARWWSQTEEPSACPKCKPVVKVDIFGKKTTEYAIVVSEP